MSVTVFTSIEVQSCVCAVSVNLYFHVVKMMLKAKAYYKKVKLRISHPLN